MFDWFGMNMTSQYEKTTYLWNKNKEAEKVRVDDDVIKWIELKANILNINFAIVINIWTAYLKSLIP